MTTPAKSPIDPENPARPPVRYKITVTPGTYQERVAHAGLTIRGEWAQEFKVDPAIAGEFWVYMIRHPTEFNPGHMASVIRSFNLEPARVEHLIGFAASFPEETTHLPLMVLDTSRIVPFSGDWQLPVYPALQRGHKLGAVGVDYKDYNKYGDRWIEDDVTILCLNRGSAANTSERREAPFKYPPPTRK